MPLRFSLLSSTMLSGIVGGVFLPVMAAQAADMTPLIKAPSFEQPAVDGLNWKAEGFGGSMADRTIFGSKGSFTAPISGQFGVQADGAIGRFDSRLFAAVGGHAFWRDPRVGLIGVYASHTYWDFLGGANVTQVAGEGEYYWGSWTVQGIAGVESGNHRSQVVSGNIFNGQVIESFDVKTRFFDKVNLAYYITPDWKAFVGHRYLGGKHALAAGTEWAMPLGVGAMASIFVEGRVGEDNFHGVWGGAKFYFGQKDKSLIRRHREDDPINWTPDTLFSIVNSLGTNFKPGLCSSDGECSDGSDSTDS
jgi:hypothetical protein